VTIVMAISNTNFGAKIAHTCGSDISVSDEVSK
jgi:hypothetical protein